MIEETRSSPETDADAWPSSPPIRALLFDLDGTIYLQAPLRRRMLMELLFEPLRSRHPLKALRTIRALGAFRRERESLRALGRPADAALATLQYSRAAEKIGGVDAEALRALVEDWMLERPLPFLRANLRPGLIPLLDFAAANGLEAGVFSDYPVEAKLRAMGLADRFSLMLDATQAEINAFKPHPRGLEHACERWRLNPAEVLYIGDRVDVDAGSAAAAGMPCAIVGAEGAGGAPRVEGSSPGEPGRAATDGAPGWRGFESFDTLRDALRDLADQGRGAQHPT